MDKDNLLVALDVGSSKVAVIAAELSPEGVVKICGIGSARSEGIRNGVVVDIGGAVRSIRAAIDEAERTSGFHIEEAYTICEDHRMRFVNHSGATPVREPEIAQGDLDSAVTNAKEVPLKDSEQVLKMVIQQYLVDGEGGILNPIGMMGNRLEASVHLICGLPTTATNLLRCVRRSGVEVKHWTVGAWASALAVLTPSERSLGVCLMDFGAGTIDITVHINNVVWFTAIIPVGGDTVTKDIAAVFQLNEEEAEHIKLKFGSADPSQFTGADVVDLTDIRRGNPADGEIEVIAQEKLAEVEEARLREMLKLAREWLQYSKFDQRIPSGIVFTGGVTETDGFLKLAEEVFEQPCRLGAPDVGQALGGAVNSPAWSAAIGLLKEAAHDAQREDHSGEHGKKGLGRGMLSAVRRWFVGSY
ncbi:MAG: cell division protein FtsA [Sutterellaceae bacterium]|nr:cell division protein FtsA [Sutterellaceae bacterium]MDD7442217.1 cell division protein FtsA [Sutterellaceae bacterium]MDY2868212.1 cell division protein FtsA [Mesosutterella sp.]